jgi:hypothetical protein
VTNVSGFARGNPSTFCLTLSRFMAFWRPVFSSNRSCVLRANTSRYCKTSVSQSTIFSTTNVLFFKEDVASLLGVIVLLRRVNGVSAPGDAT